jgi:hypothetical protein
MKDVLETIHGEPFPAKNAARTSIRTTPSISATLRFRIDGSPKPRKPPVRKTSPLLTLTTTPVVRNRSSFASPIYITMIIEW